jgi:TPP-dependent pyruvate/acetoin dehydrogenase alpha subunit
VNLEDLYFDMVRMRLFEEALSDLWSRGRISGEMHPGVGEEAIAAGVVSHLREGDALALDYRPTPVLVGRGVDMEAMFLEMLGSERGLCHGHGGHMHLFSPAHLAASTGIVGSPAPLATGLALAGHHLRPDSVALAFFGDGAANQGMVMESLNLAVVWKLPVVFVCKDNGWAVTTRSKDLTGGRLTRRARAFGMTAVSVDGRDVTRVSKAAGRAIDRARKGGGPTFLLLRCRRPRGHFADDPLVRAVRHPGELLAMLPALVGNATQSDAPFSQRIRSLGHLVRTLFRVAVDQWLVRWDPLPRARRRLPDETADSLYEKAAAEVDAALRSALAEVDR